MSTISEHDVQTFAEILARTDTTDHYARIQCLRSIIGSAEDMIAEEVAAARAGGSSWGELAPALGTSRQGAQQRYGGK